MEEGQRSPGCRSGHSVKGNTVLNVPVGATRSPVPQPPDSSPRRLTQGPPPASHLGDWKMLASSCPKHKEPPAAEWVKVTFNVLFTLLPRTGRTGLISPPFLAPLPSSSPHGDLE